MAEHSSSVSGLTPKRATFAATVAITILTGVAGLVGGYLIGNDQSKPTVATVCNKGYVSGQAVIETSKGEMGVYQAWADQLTVGETYAFYTYAETFTDDSGEPHPLIWVTRRPSSMGRQGGCK